MDNKQLRAMIYESLSESLDVDEGLWANINRF